jgi:arylsulfatase A-like enzyme
MPVARSSTALAIATCLVSCSGGDERADVLLISVDTLRADRVSAYGHGRETTPAIDALCERGVRFAEAFAPSAHTAPSHMSVFTGLDPLAHGVRNVSASDPEALRVSDALPLLPESFAEAGWATAVVGDSGNVHPQLGFDRGFDRSEFEMLAIPEKLPLVREICEGVGEGQPLFLFFHTYQVHAPYLPARRYFGRYADPGYDGPFRRRYDALGGRPLGQAFAMAGSFLDRDASIGERDLTWLSDLYDENLAWADEGIGQLLELWSELRGDDGLVVLFSDHGEEFGEHGRLGHREGLERVLTHVPLVFAGRGVGRGVCVGTVSLTGLAATLLELVGLETTDSQAPSFAAAVRDPAATPDGGSAFQQLLAGEHGLVTEALVRDGVHTLRDPASGRLTDWRASGPSQALPEQLGESQRGERLRALDGRRAQGRARAAAHPPTSGGPLDESRRRLLEALGYGSAAEQH